MKSEKIFKIVLISVLAFLLLNMFFVGFEKIQCHRMLDAIRNNDINKLEGILKFASPNCVTSTVVKSMLSEKFRYTPLGEACKESNFEIIKLLVENGADVNYVPINTKASPLGFAAESDSVDNLKLVEFLVENGADVNYYRKNQMHPAAMALTNSKPHPNKMEILEVMMEAGADPEKKLLLSTACYNGDEEAIRYLVEEWEYDASDSRYLCTYCAGVSKYSYETFEYFLERGANPYEKYRFNKYVDEKSAMDYLKEESPEWAETLAKMAEKYGMTE